MAAEDLRPLLAVLEMLEASVDENKVLDVFMSSVNGV